MSFRLTNAPTTFHSLMNEILKGLLRKCVLVFFDDILVYSSSWIDHLVKLESILEILQSHKLFARLSKCSFGVQIIEYLGHTLSGEGVVMDNSKLEAIQQWPQPNTLQQLRGFLDLTVYYRRFVKNYGKIVATFSDLLKRDCFKWSQAATTSFCQLRKTLITAPVLDAPNFKISFILETDASGSGIGVVLSQESHPIAFFSRKLSPIMQQQSAYARELFCNY